MGVLLWQPVAGLLSLFALLQPLDVMAQLERRSQLQSHVLHDDVTAQQHQRPAVDLLQWRVGRWELIQTSGRLCAAGGGWTLTCLRKSSMCGPRVWGSASWTNRMTSSTDQEVTSLPEASLSCFKWSGPVVELAAVCLKEDKE